MISTRTKSDEVVLVSDVFLLGIMQRIVVGDVCLYAVELWICRTTDRQ
jgi:hypothetical protein